MGCNKFFHFSTGGIIDVNAKIVLINTIPFRTTKFVRNVNLNYYCHLFIINSNSQWCNILALFILIYISFSKRKKKKKERKQLSFQPLGCENQILYTLKYPLMSSTLSIIRMRGGGKNSITHLSQIRRPSSYRFINASRPIHPPIRPVSIIGISSEGGGGGGILAALPRNNYDRVARRLIAFNVQPSKLPRNR